MISDIMGVNGRRMIEAMIAGVRDPGKLAALGDRRLKATPKELHDALHGRLTEHHRFVLKLHLEPGISRDRRPTAGNRSAVARGVADAAAPVVE